MMLYRELGRTGLRASAIGLGCVPLGSSSTDYAVKIVLRALELGINYIDVARSYWDSELKLGIALQGQRERVILSSKTGAKTRDDAWREIHESLERLRTSYLDNVHLHGLQPGQDLDARLGPGGALEALIEAKEQGLVRHIGCTSHHSRVLLDALRRYPFEIILVPMNIVEREPLDELVPFCNEHGVGVTIMKPLAVGLLPARLALKWLLNQPIACVVPGVSTLEELEEDARVGWEPLTLTAEEQRQVDTWRGTLEHQRCRSCSACLPCPQGIALAGVLYTDVMYCHYHNMGRQAFRAFPWSQERLRGDRQSRRQTVRQIESCDRCGVCEQRCPYGIPIIDSLQAMLPAMKEMLAIYDELLGAE